MHKSSQGKELKKHSKVKLKLYQEYLSIYLAILSNVPSCENITIFDIFCGTGLLEDGSEGSPLVALNTINSIQNPHNTNFELIVNDQDKSFIENTKKVLNENNNNSNCSMSFYNLSANEMFKKALNIINSQQRTHRNLVFIDPWGYKELKVEDFKNLLKNGRTELIVFLPLSQMYRFRNRATSTTEDNSILALRNFIKNFMKDTKPQELENVNINEFTNLLQKSLEFNKYLSSYFHLENDSNKYALFFIVHNLLALEKINEAKWKQDPICGSCFRNRDSSNYEQTDIFAGTPEQANLEDLKVELENALKMRSHNNKEVRELTLKTGYLTKHSNQILQEWKNSGKIYCVSVDTRQDSRHFYLTHKSYKDNPKIEIGVH
ncbi:MAG: three-Cys-motif partner protein TcmP [Bacteriovoracaceae bacterium]